MLSPLADFQTKTTGSIDLPKLQALQQEKENELTEPRYARYQNSLAIAKTLAAALPGKLADYSVKNHVVSIGKSEDLTSVQHQILKEALQGMIPWRKGPFELFGQRIDAEWRSDLKWERLRKVIGPLQGKVVLDIGCNNGYYLYLMAKQKPKFLLGIDPTIPYYFQFQFMNQFCPPANTLFTLHGLEHLDAFRKTFDVIFCLGIVYHHTDPLGMLEKIFQCLRPGGLLIVESMGIPGDAPLLLLPKSRYLGMPGHWFIPTAAALENLLTRSGFQYVQTFLTTELESSEQRKTEWAPFATLIDGLDEKNPKLTKEGYPSPLRFYVKARRARKGRF